MPATARTRTAAPTATLAQLLAAKPSKRAPSLVWLPSRAIQLSDDDPGEGAATTWLQVLRVGKFWSPRYKDFSVTSATLETMLSNFKEVTPKSPTELPLDYNHGTNNPETVESGKAAGWIKDVELRADSTELWAQVELTPEAANLVRAKEYRYVSATFDFDYVHTQDDQRKKSIGPTLMAAALTNTPFVEGMQPVSLAAQSSIELDADESAESVFSFDEIRRRVNDALCESFPAADGYMSCGPYLVDLFDGYLIYRSNYGGDTFRLDYTITSAGDVTFTSDPIEVRVAYEPLPAGATEMANIKIKDAAGNEIEITEETVKALAKAHAPKGVDVARLDEIEVRLTRSDAQIVELTAKNLALETEKTETAAKAKVDELIRAGKLAPKQRAEWTKLAIADRETFRTLTDGLPVSHTYNLRTGSSDDIETRSAVDEALALARSEMDKDTKLSMDAALSRVFQKDGALYQRYKAEAAVKA